jgi:hypothetical protein
VKRQLSVIGEKKIHDAGCKIQDSGYKIIDHSVLGKNEQQKMMTSRKK